MSALFTPLRVGHLELANRIVIAPMCQYSAVDGCMTDWHVIHLGHLAISGAALLTIEATAVLPEGRITYADIGLWNDATEVPWKGGAQIPPGSTNGWQTVAPSAVPYVEGDRPPITLDRDGLARVRDAFAAAAQRA